MGQANHPDWKEGEKLQSLLLCTILTYLHEQLVCLNITSNKKS